MDRVAFVPVARSLRDLLGAEYVEAVGAAHAFLHGTTLAQVWQGDQAVEFYPAAMQERLAALLPQVGTQVLLKGLPESNAGASAKAFDAATKRAAAPLGALGYYRVGEDGQLYLMTKSEHYHAPLGHAFPGYRLIEQARALGIPNATHNNTRGYITRLLEQELVRTAHGLAKSDQSGLRRILDSGDLYTPNRVLNLETGSLAVEAALKMILARFYRIQPEIAAPPYEGRVPVILVMGNDDGGLQANYHGTTIMTQMLRGMWPALHEEMQRHDLWQVVPIRPNCTEDLDRAFAEYDSG